MIWRERKGERETEREREEEGERERGREEEGERHGEDTHFERKQDRDSGCM